MCWNCFSLFWFVTSNYTGTVSPRHCGNSLCQTSFQRGDCCWTAAELWLQLSTLTSSLHWIWPRVHCVLLFTEFQEIKSAWLFELSTERCSSTGTEFDSATRFLWFKPTRCLIAMTGRDWKGVLPGTKLRHLSRCTTSSLTLRMATETAAGGRRTEWRDSEYWGSTGSTDCCSRHWRLQYCDWDAEESWAGTLCYSAGTVGKCDSPDALQWNPLYLCRTTRPTATTKCNSFGLGLLVAQKTGYESTDDVWIGVLSPNSVFPGLSTAPLRLLRDRTATVLAATATGDYWVHSPDWQAGGTTLSSCHFHSHGQTWHWQLGKSQLSGLIVHCATCGLIFEALCCTQHCNCGKVRRTSRTCLYLAVFLYFSFFWGPRYFFCIFLFG